MQKTSGNRQFSINSIKDDTLRTYVQHLSDSLTKQNQELKIQSLQNKLYQKSFQASSLQPCLDHILKEMRMTGCSSMRILIQRSGPFGGEAFIKAEKGENTQAYAYLDDQILQQLKDKSQLIIPDTTKIHSIKFSPDKKYPKTIVAYHFLKMTDANGFLWMSFDAVKELTDFERELFAQTLPVLAEICQSSLLQDNLQTKFSIFEKTVNRIDLPIVVLKPQQGIIYANQAANEKFSDHFESIAAHALVTEWLNSEQVHSGMELEIGGRHYQASGFRLALNEEEQIALITFADDTVLNTKQEYLTLIMETVSHDFRIPLVNLQGFTKLLSMVGELNPKQTEYLDSIQSGIEEISLVVDDLFAMNRMLQEEGLKLTECFPKDLIEKAVSLVQAEARQKRVEIQCNLIADELSVWVDQALIISALYNLLNNAVKNSRIGTTVTVEDSMIEKSWLVSIQDSGRGISQIDIEKLESNHFLSKDGSGLSIVDKIARFHQGTLKIESELGKGSKLILQLPCFK